MTDADKKELEAQLPPGWSILTKLTQEKDRNGRPVHYHEVTLRAVSDKHNVVLEGTFEWIKRKATAYACSGRAS